MLLLRLKAVAYLAFILFVSFVINASKIPPESYAFLGVVSFCAILYAFVDPRQFIQR